MKLTFPQAGLIDAGKSLLRIALVFTVLIPMRISADQSGVPGLYAFENGLGFGTDAEEAAFLKNAGYAGVSQVQGGVGSIVGKIEAYEKEGLRVLSVYRDVDGAGLDDAGLRPLADKGALIELTVKKISPETPARISEICLLAERLGIRVAIYPHHGFGISTMPQAMDMVAKVDSANLGIMFNLCHFLRGESLEDLEKVITAAGEKLFAVSVSGADAEGKEWDQLIKRLGEGDFPMGRLLAALRKSGFSGPIALQCYNLKGDKKENLKASMTAWKAVGGLE